MDINGNKTRVRVMDGNGNNNYGPRISVTNAKEPKQMVDPATGRPFPNNVTKPERINKGHIPLKSPGS